MEELHAYRADLLVALESAVSELAGIIAGVPAGKWHQPMNPAANTPHFILFRLRELEKQLFTSQMPRILAEDVPTLPVFDVESWMADHYQAGESPSSILEGFSSLRFQQLARLRQLPPGDWSRLARHPWWGLHTLQWWVELQVDYSTQHLGQLSTISVSESSS